MIDRFLQISRYSILRGVFDPKVELELPSERSLGFSITAAFAVYGLWPLFSRESVRLWSLAVGTVVLMLGLFVMRTLRMPNLRVYHLGLLLGPMVSPIPLCIYKPTQLFRFIYNLSRPIGQVVHRTFMNSALFEVFPGFCFATLVQGLPSFIDSDPMEHR